jgi:hypothetical protein
VHCKVTADNCSFITVSKTCDYLIAERNFKITQFGVGFGFMDLICVVKFCKTVCLLISHLVSLVCLS